jgi:type IX secretion system PorP/SprF family membrane protein
MKLRNIFKLSVLALFTSFSAEAQDVHFSQFAVSNLTMNPATTGVMSCNMRASAIYRNQWGSVMGSNAFNTFGFGIEGKFNSGRHDYWGAGMSFWADKAGASNFSSVQASFSSSYLKKIGGRRSNEHYLVAGGQIGFNQRSLSLDKLRWGENWNGTGFDGSLSSNETLFNTSTTVADVNVGLLWFSALDRKNKNNVYGGFALHHITGGNLSFTKQQTEPLYTKLTIHGGGEVRLDRRLALVPGAALYFQGASTMINAGTSIKFDFSKRSSSSQAFTVGAFLRTTNKLESGMSPESIIMLVRTRYSSHHFGFSYDINISPLVVATGGNGAFELSYVYTMCGQRGRRLGCPTF